MKKVKFKGVTWMRPASVLFLLLISVGCSHNGNGTAGDVNTAGQVELCISAGGGAVSTRTAFNEGTPVEILAYARRQDAPGTEAFAGPALIYVAEGMATGLGEEETALSGVTVARVNGKVVADGRLLVEAGYIYDVVVLANTSSQEGLELGNGTKGTSFGVLNGMFISGVTHGQDILAGRASGVVTEQTGGVRKVKVTFEGDGSDGEPDRNGNLPHLGAAVKVEARLQQEVFDMLLKGNKRQVCLGIDGIVFNYCLPSSANLPLVGGSAPRKVAYVVQTGGYNTSYAVRTVQTEAVEVNAPYDENKPDKNVARSGDGYVLPCPLKSVSEGHNTMDITFNLLIDGGGVALNARNVQLPAFNPGYRYTFVVEFGIDPDTEEGRIDLLLGIDRWDTASWTAVEGGYDTGNRVLVSVGGWNSIAYRIVEGAYGTEKRLLIEVDGFDTTSWGSTEGKYEDFDNDGGTYVTLDNFTGVKWQTEEGRYPADVTRQVSGTDI